MENIALEFQIGEISHFFDIPASTLRYWEEMQVLSPNKGETSHYREYAVEDLMTISDVIFYKNLGFQLKQIREMKSNTPKQQANLFEQKLSELEQEQELLRLRMKKLQRHIEAVKTLEKLRQTPYQETEIDTECIVSFELIEQEKLLQYIEDPYLYSRVQHTDTLQQEQRGLTVLPDASNVFDESHIIWRKHGGRYMTFLMKEEVAENYPNDLQKHIEYLQQYYKTGDVISRFLLCAQEDGKVYDFYKTFVEIC